jgi:hypothetical protein
MMEHPFGLMTKESYIEDLKQRAQFDVVTFKAGLIGTTNVQTWTRRNTACDVISVVTTSGQVNHGSMQDLRLKFNETHTYVNSCEPHADVIINSL